MNTITRHTSPTDTPEAVAAYLKSLIHPMKAEILLMHAAILAADPTIKAGVKWNAPSYRTGEYFATTNLREKKGIGIILHLGAKVRELKPVELEVEDSTSMLRWLSKDRAMVSFSSSVDFQAKSAAFAALIRSWVRHV